MSGQEFSLQTTNGRFAGLRWPNPGAQKMLCLHGWLDNAASFSPIAPYLSAFDLLALDFAGHGHSDHRPRGARYYMMNNVFDVDAVLDALDWPATHLLGHSLGGVVACNYAAAAPERVDRLVTLDGLGSLSARSAETAKRLRKSLQSIRGARGELRDYPDIESAARARQRASGLPLASALVLAERSLEQHGEVFRWRTDPALNWHSPSLMTEEQVIDILAAIEAPTLSITCDQLADLLKVNNVSGRAEAVADCRHRVIEGHHHFHMDQPQQTASLILEFVDPEEPAHDHQ